MKRTTILFTIIILMLFSFSACSQKKEEKPAGFDLANLDTTASPGQDFYQYAIGGWLKKNPIPDDQTMRASFSILEEKTKSQLKTIIDEASQNPGNDPKSIKYQVATIYNSGMDTTKLDKEGWQPIAKELDRIKAITDKDGIVKEIAHMHIYTSSPLFNFGSGIDAKNSKEEIAQLKQGGLGLPDRDYYFNDDAKSKETREKYVNHIKNIFMLVGENEAASEKKAKTIMAFETKLAGAARTREQNRDPKVTYNKMSSEKLIKMAPGFDWALFFSECKLGDPKIINVAQPEFAVAVGKITQSEPLATWKAYLEWNVLNAMAPYLSSDFVDEDFDFNGKYMSGLNKQKPRWKQVLNAIDGHMGEGLGELYVAKYFPPEAKERAQQIVKTIIASMKERIENVAWMSNATKKEAVKKLAKMKVKIGYPDKWRDYTSFEAGDTYVDNIIKLHAVDHADMISKINKPMRPWEWRMTPQMVNAYNSPNRNQIVFTAAILQSPFYDYRVDDAINYGGMGAVIGHEITHGFDDNGRQYDSDGNLKDWWTKEDAARFQERAKGLMDQFSAYNPVGDLHINGKTNIGEIIADLGGLTVAYNAFIKTEQFKKGEKIDGFTPAQRFFLSWAQVWATNMRDEALIKQIKTDNHPPAKYRVLGPLSNLQPFFDAFDIKEGEPMRRDTLLQIW